MIKVAIVGVGGMGSTHFNLYRGMNDVEIVALVDVEPEKTAEKAKACGARSYTNIEDMLKNEKPDIADICTPSYFHCANAVAAMEKGCHVITEKPAALNTRDVMRMFTCAEENNVFFMVAHVLRFWPEYVWLKNTVDSGKYGKLLHLAMWRTGDRPRNSWQNWMLVQEKSGLVPFDLHIHDIDFMVYLLGEPNKTDKYQINNGAGQYVETTCQYKNGTRVHAKAAWYNGCVPFTMGYEAQFEMGYADFRKDLLVFYPNDVEPETPTVTSIFTGSEINVANTSGYLNELKFFIQCVTSGKKPDIMTQSEILITLALLS